ncbi:hypothetical protein KA005_24565, partial [bacterium]|nr:hypothetical protein [bacterium]
MKRISILIMAIAFLALFVDQALADVGIANKKKPILNTVAGEKVLALAYKGTSFEILEKRGDWVKVSLVGWMRKNAVDIAVSQKELPAELADFIQLAKSLISTVESGVSYEEYENMLSNLKTSSDLTVANLMDTSDIQKKIVSITTCFITAGNVWCIRELEPEAKPCITDGTIELLYTSNYPDLQTYVDKYKSLIPQATYFDNIVNHDVLSLLKYCQLLWKKAEGEIKQLEA